MSNDIERLHIHVSDDALSATISISGGALEGDAHFDYDEVLAHLTSEEGLSGIVEDELRQFIDDLNADPLEFRGSAVIAQGKQAVKGQDAALIWCIERDSTPEVDASGRVDFYSICTLKNARQGDAIARIKPPIPGEDGVNVRGEAIPAEPVKDIEYQAGENVDFIEDVREFKALLNGRVELRGSSICVSEVYEVDGDVDFNTGHINFAGFVRVKGDVQENFRVVAGKGIQVDGSVDAATLESGGTITVMGGINGKNKGLIDAEGDVVCPFLRNVEVRAGASVNVQKEVINCVVRAGRVEFGEAHVEGGEISATGNINVSDAGSKVAVKTILHAGYDYFLDQQTQEDAKLLEPKKSLREKLQEKIEAAHAGYKMLPKPSRAKLEEGMTNLLTYLDDLVTLVESKTQEIDANKKKIKSRNREIEIQNRIYPGVVVRIGKYDRPTDKEYDGYRRFAFDPKRFEVVPFYDRPGAPVPG